MELVRLFGEETGDAVLTVASRGSCALVDTRVELVLDALGGGTARVTRGVGVRGGGAARELLLELAEGGRLARLVVVLGLVTVVGGRLVLRTELLGGKFGGSTLVHVARGESGKASVTGRVVAGRASWVVRLGVAVGRALVVVGGVAARGTDNASTGGATSLLVVVVVVVTRSGRVGAGEARA